MAKVPVMTFKKGDGLSHGFKIPASSFVPGGKLWFTAKKVIDNDATDALAVIKKQFDDTVVSNVTVKGVAYKRWQLDFVPADIVNVNYANGQKKLKFLGEFQIVPLVGAPTSFPADDEFIEVIIYADVMRGTS
jgi:hypothetical protein